jgi:hypothetical protein
MFKKDKTSLGCGRKVSSLGKVKQCVTSQDIGDKWRIGDEENPYAGKTL